MPEILEIELYRRSMAPIVGRTITGVDAPDDWYLKGGLTADVIVGVLPGHQVVTLRRRGKLLLLDLRLVASACDACARDQTRGSEGGVDVVLGLRFGMTGRPIVDDGAAPFALEYSSASARSEWDRFVLHFDDAGSLRINDPRRLGGVELDPDEERLGPDAFALTPAQLRAALASNAPVKAVLLDQGRIAGLGNMLVDEVLFRSGIDPARPARDLTKPDTARLLRSIRAVLPELLELGGSHAGRLAAALRVRGARCPKDGTELTRRTIGGRTTYACPLHQR